MADTDLYHWLALRCVGGIGNVTYVNLVRHFGTPELVFQAAPDALMQVDGVTAKTAAAIAGFAAHDEFRRELERVAALGISIVTVASSEYPELLRQVYDPPPFLYVKGKLHHDDRNAVAIV
ncbi:MAG: DNA-protecting protein DprA, partial [Deltaproteobacteria bacterium]|nr:DNA-protecting protein DprA [Deltaproteobacteria bacterium]